MAGNCPWYWTANNWNVSLVAIKQMEGKKINKIKTPLSWIELQITLWTQRCSFLGNSAEVVGITFFLDIFLSLFATSLNFRLVPQLSVSQDWPCLTSIHRPRLVKCFIALVNSSYSSSLFAAGYSHKQGWSLNLLKFLGAGQTPMASGWPFLFCYFPMFYFIFSL